MTDAEFVQAELWKVANAARRQVAEEIAQAIEAFEAESGAAPMAVQLAMGSGHNYLVRAVEIAREIGSKEAGA